MSHSFGHCWTVGDSSHYFSFLHRLLRVLPVAMAAFFAFSIAGEHAIFSLNAWPGMNRPKIFLAMFAKYV